MLCITTWHYKRKPSRKGGSRSEAEGEHVRLMYDTSIGMYYLAVKRGSEEQVEPLMGISKEEIEETGKVLALTTPQIRYVWAYFQLNKTVTYGLAYGLRKDELPPVAYSLKGKAAEGGAERSEGVQP